MRERLRKRMVVPLFLIMLLFAAIPVYASDEKTVYDAAGLLSGEQWQSVLEQVTSLETETGWDIFAVTTDDTGEKTSREYADDYYDSNAEGEDGIVVLIDMDNREVTISTAGKAIYYLTDERIDAILDEGYPYASDADYEGCFVSLLNGVEHYYKEGIDTGTYTYDEETGEIHYYRVLTAGEAVFAFIVAAIVFAAVFFGITGKYRLKFGGEQAYDYHSFGNVALSNQKDRFVNQIVTHRRIERQTENKGGGGENHPGRSTVHTSSSGTSHGGGSRKF